MKDLLKKILVFVIYLQACVNKNKIETIDLKFIDGKIVPISLHTYKDYGGNPEQECIENKIFIKIYKELKEGNKTNLNKSIKIFDLTILSLCSLNIFESGELGDILILKYLLEQGANPNIVELETSSNLNSPNKKLKKVGTRLPIVVITDKLEFYFLKKHENHVEIELHHKCYKTLLKAFSLLLIYSAKIKLKDWIGKCAYNLLPKGKEGTSFATEICELLLKEKDITKLDPDFIEYAKECYVDPQLIQKIENKRKGKK